MINTFLLVRPELWRRRCFRTVLRGGVEAVVGEGGGGGWWEREVVWAVVGEVGCGGR